MAKTISIDSREGHFGVTLSTSESCYGAKVDHVHAQDLFARAGVKSGCVITHVNGTAVDTHASAMDLLSDAQDAVLFAKPFSSPFGTSN